MPILLKSGLQRNSILLKQWCRNLPRGTISISSNEYHIAERTAKRYRSSIFFSDEKGSAEENVYFKKEDDLLLKNLLSNHPEFNPKYSTASLEDEVGTLARDLHLVCKKHGVSNVSIAFIRDVQTVFEMHGWKKPSNSSSKESSSSPSSSSSSSGRSLPFPRSTIAPSAASSCP